MSVLSVWDSKNETRGWHVSGASYTQAATLPKSSPTMKAISTATRRMSHQSWPRFGTTLAGWICALRDHVFRCMQRSRCARCSASLADALTGRQRAIRQDRQATFDRGSCMLAIHLYTLCLSQARLLHPDLERSLGCKYAVRNFEVQVQISAELSLHLDQIVSGFSLNAAIFKCCWRWRSNGCKFVKI